MAKQTGAICIEGCFGNIVFYRLGEGYYARLKSSLSGQRVKQDAAFKKTMEYAGMFATASVIASQLYRSRPADKKEKETYRKLAGKVMKLLKENKTREEIIQELQQP